MHVLYYVIFVCNSRRLVTHRGAFFWARSARPKKPGFPLQVLGFAYANPAGFPLQSLARAPAAADREFFCGAKKILGVNHAIFLRKNAPLVIRAELPWQLAARNPSVAILF
ncbi:MAG: hypothetical protein LBK13_07515 [Spirochaetales bacterium]|jgi:hypothetical protein|nr:hypothetical protein [Spirochaetales bacterium]